MKLFLCSHFSSVGSLIKEEIENKKVAFIPTASLREGYTGYVGFPRHPTLTFKPSLAYQSTRRSSFRSISGTWKTRSKWT